jgi:DNA-binding NarL/FixJ family response regulator
VGEIRFRAALAHGDERVRDSARAVLQRMGAEVVEPAGVEPLAVLVDGVGVDVVVAADDAPIGGVDVLRACRRRGGTTPFVILSRAIDELLWCAIELRLVSLVSTPFQPDTLVAALRGFRGGIGGARA